MITGAMVGPPVIADTMADHPRLRTWFDNRSDPPARITVGLLTDRPWLPAEHETFGRVPADPACHPPIMAGFFGMTLVLAGDARMDTGNGLPVPVRTGDLVAWHGVHAGQKIMSGGPGFRELTVCIDLATGRRLVDQGCWDTGWTRCPGARSPALPAALLVAWQRLFDQVGEPTASPAAVHGRLLMLLAEIERVRAAAANDFTARATTLISQRLHPGDDLSDVSATLGLSATAFRRRFRAATGMSPRRWLIHRRMRCAAELLPGRSVDQVAHELGYADPSLFRRQFHEVMGIAPGRLSHGCAVGVNPAGAAAREAADLPSHAPDAQGLSAAR